MDRKCKAYLGRAAVKGGFTDKTGDYATIGVLIGKGLVTVTEKIVAIKNVGIVPVPHIEATDAGRTVLAALS